MFPLTLPCLKESGKALSLSFVMLQSLHGDLPPHSYFVFAVVS